MITGYYWQCKWPSTPWYTLTDLNDEDQVYATIEEAKRKTPPPGGLGLMHRLVHITYKPPVILEVEL